MVHDGNRSILVRLWNLKPRSPCTAWDDAASQESIPSHGSKRSQWLLLRNIQFMSWHRPDPGPLILPLPDSCFGLQILWRHCRIDQLHLLRLVSVNRSRIWRMLFSQQIRAKEMEGRCFIITTLRIRDMGRSWADWPSWALNVSRPGREHSIQKLGT